MDRRMPTLSVNVTAEQKRSIQKVAKSVPGCSSSAELVRAVLDNLASGAWRPTPQAPAWESLEDALRGIWALGGGGES